MPNQQLVEYIKNQHARGFNYEQIQEFLINSGHNAEDVKESLILATKKKHNILWLSFVLIIILGASFAVWQLDFFKPKVEMPGEIEQSEQRITFCMQFPCFLEKFKNCGKAQVRVNLNKTVYLYESLGYINNKCEVRVRSIIHKNTEWRGKEMRCYLDTPNFVDPVENSSSCNGFLKELLDQPI